MSIQRTLDFCNKAYHTTKMYVQVSEKYIMKRIDHMQLMRTLPLSEHEGGNKKLTESCEEISQSIKEMYMDDKAEVIR
ncbi:hypothetical protein DAPPUDRAFT_252415 [Daphnia pulex]|uniref:Uncharacterized protein n=1 Tax=Daphnia pulex TaxID=6669 RepID=E9H2M1_DAPPU|nr:hypothetical protein DAPPUDRAFT_252415 [Daphnia pulex]|eukprot:EFX73998.1 hypothetical protein DAPPUDRAFT_252415 [Daphnia pulex]